MIIGQTDLKEKIDKLITRFPRFSIVVGPEGSGKKEICKYICNKLSIPLVKYSQKIDDVREAITVSYEQTEPICYLFADADDMSLAAKNCLLKITEEPPKNAYFIITLKSLENTLPTIKSRGTVLNLDVYSKQEIIDYRKYRKYNESNDNLVYHICDTTGEVDELFKCDIPGFYKYATNIVDFIHKVNSGNIFKISKQMKLKDTESGYDPILLFKTVRNLYIQKAKESGIKEYLLASNVTSDCIRDLRLQTVSRQATIDMWIMNVRSVLRGV